MEWWHILLIILGTSLVLASFGYIFFISRLMAVSMVQPKHFKTQSEKDNELAELGDIDGVQEYSRTPIEFVMEDGYVIHGDYSLNNPKKFVICMHGHCGMRGGSIKYSYAFYRLGYSLIFFDHRSHGENKRELVTMGYQEHKDALQIIKQVREKFGEDIELGLFGCSMGGATALMCLKECQDLSFVVSDCAFASLKNLVAGFCRQHKSPKWMFLGPTNLILKVKYHFSFKDACALDSVKQNEKVPVLIIHGTQDDFVYPHNAYELYQACGGKKRLEMFEGAVHCGSVVTDRRRYYKVIENFIKESK